MKKICILTLLLIEILITNAFAQTRNYPFPQNYLYSYGQIHTGSNVHSTIQGLFNNWKTTYYTEGTINGTPCARIKYIMPNEDGTATISDGIGYGMLIFVYMDNATNSTQDEFNKLWAYYQKNSNSNGLMYKKTIAYSGTSAIGSGNEFSSTNADINVAQALLMAHKQWGSLGTVNYKSAAQNLINAIYTNEVDANKLLKPSDAFNDWANPSYYILNATELFGRVEILEGWQALNRWNAVTTACYNVMKTSRNATTGLVPDWCTTPTGAAITGIIDDTFQSYALNDAARIPWNMAQAYAWYGHTDAKDIASKITAWAQTTYSDPATIWNGYNLDGTIFTNSTANTNFTTFGINHNPCFSGGLSIGSMVDPTFASYMNKCWTVGSSNDPYGDYYTHTTQLLYMLTATGNTPNLWDMKPVPVSAQTNDNGNIIYINFSKSLATTTSTIGWTVETFADDNDVTPKTISVSSIIVNEKIVTVELSSETTEPVIKISYNGTTITSVEENFRANPFSKLTVVNKITNIEPYPTLRFTDVLGTKILIQWNKEILESSINANHFTVKVNGIISPISTVTLDVQDASITQINLIGTSFNGVSDIVSVSFLGGSITGTLNTLTAKPFTDARVQNFYLSSDCYTISDFDGTTNVGITSWIAGAWNSVATDPITATNKVGYFNGDNATSYLMAKGIFNTTNQPAFGTALFETGSRFKARAYVKAGTFASGEKIRIVFAHAALADAGSYYDPNQVALFITPPTTDTWFEIDVPIDGIDDNLYDYIQITGSNVDATGNKTNAEFYLDDMRICPAQPNVAFENAKLNFNGTQIEIKFSSAIKVPTNTNIISITSDGVSQTISKIEAKQGEASTLILTLESPINTTTASILATYANNNGTLLGYNEIAATTFTNMPISNLLGIAIINGWRDDFSSTTDGITNSIGVGTSFDLPAPVESAVSPGTYKIVGDGVAAWSSVDVTTWSNTTNASKEVMDLTGRETIQIRYRIPSSTSTTLYMRVDLKDKDNEYVSDAMTFIPLTVSSTWQDKTIDVSSIFFNQYSYGDKVTVDKSNIYQVLFYFIEKEGTAANSYVPTTFNGTIEFDYISIGEALTLNVPVTSINEGQSLAATSSESGKIYLVPNNTAPILSALQESIFIGTGKVVDATAATPISIATIGLATGYYSAYAYNPITNSLSSKVTIQINDVTAPIITQASSGNVTSNGTISVTVNEDAMVYLIPAAVTNYSLANIIDNAIYNLAVVKDISSAISLSTIIPSEITEQSYKFIAVDYASPIPNISIVSNPNIIITVIEADKTLLIATIANAQEIIANAIIGNSGGQYPLSAGINLTNAINAATVVNSNISSTQVQVDAAVTELNVAISTFQASLIIIEKIALQNLISEVQIIYDDAIVGTGNGQYTQSSKDYLYAALTEANTAYNNATTQTQVDAAVVTLNTALAVFLSSEILETKVSSISISPTTSTLLVDETILLTATVLPINATNNTLIWTSSNPTIATVIQGVIIAKEVGTAIITATAADGSNVSAISAITVISEEVEPCATIQVFEEITNILCSGEKTGEIQVAAVGGTAPYTYQWSNSRSDNTIVNMAAGTYTVIVTDANGCATVKTYEITEPETITISATKTSPTCNIANGSIALTVIGGETPYAYNWNEGSTTASIVNKPANMYTVNITDNNGCQQQRTFELNNIGAPIIELDTIIATPCNVNNGEIQISVSGGTTPYNYVWNDALVIEDRISLEKGTYNVKVTDASGCIATLFAEVPSFSFIQPTISLVTVDEITGKNKIAWQKEETNAIDFYTVYRETVAAGTYESIGDLPYSEVSVFVDQTANSLEQSWRYKLSATDFCGNESDLSSEHKTIHLQKNISIDNSINLDWDAYEGLDFYTYIIYRKSSLQGLQEIKRIPSSITRFTDINAPNDVQSYYVSILLPETINILNPLLKSENETTFTNSKSNTTEVGLSLSEINNGISVYPTITNSSIFIDLGEHSTKTKISILSENGIVVLSLNSINQSKIEIPVSNFAKGLYTVKVEIGDVIKSSFIVIQ